MQPQLRGVPVVYTVRLRSPLMIRSRRHRVGYEPLTDRIPASTLGGALVAAGLASQEDFVNGNLFIADAYPVTSDCEPSMPAPGFCTRLKKGAVELHQSFSRLEAPIICIPSVLQASNPAEKIVEEISKLSERVGTSLAALMKPVVGTPIVCRQERLEELQVLACREAEVRGAWRDSVAMSYKRRRSEEGMLYSYEAVEHELWWGVARLPNELAKKLVKDKGGGGVEIWLGGGKSKGFGQAVLEATPLDTRDLEKVQGDWYMLWTPLPLLPSVHRERELEAFPPATIDIASWGSQGARPVVKALAPGVLVKQLRVDLVQARLSGLVPPHGSAEPLGGDGLPPSLLAAQMALKRLCGNKGKSL